MRTAGISGADLSGDLGSIETELTDDEAAIDGGDGTPPDTNTGTELGGGNTPGTAQTI